jgi:lysophospholipase L1-like esterase
MKNPNLGPVRYVALGDSTGAGVGAKEGGYVARLFRRISEVRAESSVTNLCVSGATTEDVLARQVSAAVAAKPTLITIGIGINDIGHGFSPQQFRENLNAILARLRAGTEVPIVISNIPDISSAPRIPRIMRPETQRLIELFNREISILASKHEAYVVDVYHDTHELLPTHPEYFSADGFHPSDEGYEVWAERMWPTVAQAIGAGTS